tara:strand:- start:16 stop:222 length:207 start_codon:yes stop_codon:yes gene_type:complete
MLTVDREHLNKVKMSYFEHARFAFGISKKLLVSSIFFLVHGTVPIVQFEEYDLNSIVEYLKDKHEKRS